MLVVVECDAAADDVGTIAEQWAQEIRFRASAHGIATGASSAVVLDGTLADFADALRAAYRGLTT